MKATKMQQITELAKLPSRPADSHKGTFGRVLVVAGSVGMAGAAALTAKAALRAGAGLVQVATAKSALPTVAAIEPCYTTLPLAEDIDGKISGKDKQQLLEAVDACDVVAVGPGLGTSPLLQELIGTIISQKNLRIVIDGDGLNNLAKLTKWPENANADIVLTPHPGEMKRLWRGLFDKPLPDDRKDQTIKLAQRSSAVISLKGKATVVADTQKYYINTTGNPGMATGGSGDVLTGIIAALMGQGLDSLNAAVLGVYIHGLAGDIAAEKFGQISTIATDLIDYLPQAFKTFTGEKNDRRH